MLRTLAYARVHEFDCSRPFGFSKEQINELVGGGGILIVVGEVVDVEGAVMVVVMMGSNDDNE